MQTALSKKERTRKSIIQWSAPIFNKKGYQATSLSDIEKATTLTKGSIYNNFADKDELAIAVFRYNVNHLNSDIAAAIRGVNSVKDKLKAYCDYYRNNYRRHFERGGCPVLNMAVEADDVHPTLKALVGKVFHNWESVIINLIEKGKQSGELAADVNSKQFASVFMSLIEGGVLLSKTTGDKTYLLSNLKQIEQWVDELRVK